VRGEELVSNSARGKELVSHLARGEELVSHSPKEDWNMKNVRGPQETSGSLSPCPDSRNDDTDAEVPYRQVMVPQFEVQAHLGGRGHSRKRVQFDLTSGAGGCGWWPLH